MTTIRAIGCIATLIFLCGICTVVRSQERDNILADLDVIKDPFMPQLPEPAKILKPTLDVSVKAAPVEFVPKSSAQKAQVDASITVPKLPEVVKKPNMGSIILKGVVWNSDNPQAIVNDKVMNVGDEINGLTIIAINREGVDFYSNGETTSLKISKPKGVVATKP